MSVDNDEAKGDSQQPVKLEPCAKRIRAYLGGELIADTTSSMLVWEEVVFAPVYYFPIEDVYTDRLVEMGDTVHSPNYGGGPSFDVEANGKRAAGAAVRYDDSPLEALRGRVRFEFDAMDAWFEEDEEIFTHVRDPYHRVDILPSSRHVRVVIDGVTVAESTNSRILFETTLPARFYVPKPHVHMDLLVPSDTVTHCPYKGQAQTWSVYVDDKLHKDVAWSYRTPLPESQKIAGHVAFLNEHVDHYIDGQLQERPVSEFS
jgi:uncharacterized protein (DUF427 family)